MTHDLYVHGKHVATCRTAGGCMKHVFALYRECVDDPKWWYGVQILRRP